MATTINVSAGEVFSDTVPANTSVFILEGGSASGASLISRGFMGVTNGGKTTSVAASAGGLFYVSQGGLAEETVLGSNGYVRVLDQGTVNVIEVNPYASMFVSSGATAYGILENGGHVEVTSGATATFTPNIISGLVMDREYQKATVHSGTTAFETAISAYQCNMYVYEGGLVVDTDIINGYLYVYSGGSASRTRAEYYSLCLEGGTATIAETVGYGSIDVTSGGLMESATVNASGNMNLRSGGRATDTVVKSGANLTVYMYASAAGTEIQSGGYAYLYGGGTMTDVTLRKGAVISTTYDSTETGTIDGLVLDAGATVTVSKGFDVKNVKENGGAIVLEEGVEATYVSNTFSNAEVASYGRATVHSGTTAVDTVNNAQMDVYSGGTAIRTALTGYDARINVYSSGLADGVTGTGSYNATIVYDGGTVKNAVLDNYARVYVYAGGVISGLEQQYAFGSCYGEISGLVMNNVNAWMDVYEGGKLSDAVINAGTVNVSNGAQVSGMTINSGNVGIGGGTATDVTVCSGGTLGGGAATMSNVLVSGGRLDVYSDTSLDGLEITDNIDRETWTGKAGQVVLYGGTVENTSVTGYGSVTLSSGAVANNTVLSRTDELRSTYGGDLHISSGAVANNTTVGENYSVRVWSGGSASGVTVLSGGFLDVGSVGGAYLTGAEISNGGWCRLSSGTTATDLVIHKGGEAAILVAPGTDVQGTYDGSAFHVQSGVMSDFTVLDRGIAPIVCSGGTLTNVTTVRDGGNFCVSSGGTVLGTVSVEQGGSMFCYGGTVEKVLENGGYVDAHPYYGTDITFGENTFSGVHLTSGMSATVHSGTTANSTLIEGIYSSGAGASIRIYSGGVASNTEAVHCGYLEVSSGGTAVKTLLHSSATIRLEGGGSAVSTTLKDGGRLYASTYSALTAYVSDTVISSGGTLHLAPYSGCVSACDTVVESGGTLPRAPGLELSVCNPVRDQHQIRRDHRTRFLVLLPDRCGFRVRHGRRVRRDSNSILERLLLQHRAQGKRHHGDLQRSQRLSRFRSRSGGDRPCPLRRRSRDGRDQQRGLHDARGRH